ncbi:hypothetical protein E4T39_01044 [Aureobasidium subglaciale]|nr:hypothetical protein E4T39_01044 [Aureobasidium subglaciale]
MACPQSPASDASSDLYAEVDTSSQRNLLEPSRQHVGSPASLPMYDDSPVPPPAQTKGKRRFGDEHLQPQAPLKKRKLVLTPERYFSPAIPQTANLPAEVWQYVFLHLTPDNLSRCLRVSRLFRSYLTDLTASMSIRLPPRANGLKLIDSEGIWTSARKIFAPNIPRPLAGFTEMHMFQLLGGRDCQACGAFPLQPNQPTTPFDAGPGLGGVRIIWSFSARLCSECFELYSVKDVDVVVSPVNPLRAGLPYAFCTPDLHYIPATLQAQAAASIKGTMSKVYSQKHIDDLQQEHQNAMEFGDAAAEEWVKGLPLLGKQQMADAARWERWESQLPLGSDIFTVLREYFRSYSVPMIGETPVTVESAPEAAVEAPTVSVTSLPAPPSAQSKFSSASPVTVIDCDQTVKHPLPARVVAVPTATQPIANAQSPQQSSKKEWRPPRNMKEVNEARASRRADIERRCYNEFQPPLMPNVLQHMESFHAAMQITTPLTDSAWEVLKPRLYTQRDAAEQIEYHREEQMRALQATIPDPAYPMYSQPVDPTVLQRQYEAAQVPIRKKLGMYAEDLIRIKWKKGKILTRDNCPEFAVEVLLYARNRFLEVERPHDLPQDHMTEETDPWFVSLENMRWLYDHKVKTNTDRYLRELFHCAECGSLGKSYAFEGMIQHYGAKHTTEFSRGNIVVHWQSAEWPDECPLVPCNGATPDPTMPPKPAKKAPDAVEVNQHKSLEVLVNTAQSPYHNIPAYQNGPPWPTAGEGGLYDQSVYPAYPSDAHPRYAQYGHSYTQAGTPADPHHPHGSYPPPVDPGSIYQGQVDSIANIARETWDTIGGITGLEESVRVHTVLHHVVSRFKSQFGSEPSLDMLNDALVNHSLMRPIKDASGMACMTCISSNLDGFLAFKPYAKRIADYTLYNTSSLITHFRTVHLGSDSGLDWKEDMIELPEDDNIRQLLIAVGMNDEKLGMIAEVFPKLFPNPLPKIGEVKEAFKPLPKKEPKTRANQKKTKKQRKSSAPHPATLAQGETSEEPSDALPEAAEDEYDPRRPAFIERGAKGSGQLTKKPHNDSHRHQPPVDLTQLAPETLEALSRLRPSDPEVQKALAGRTERSPSVPRANGSHPPPVDTSRQNRAAFEANRVSAYQPQQAREANARSNGRHDRAGDDEPAEDYTQIIRTPASGPYGQHTAVGPMLSVPPQDRYVRLDSRGQPMEHPRYESAPFGYEHDPRAGHQEYYSRPEFRTEHPPPVSYAYEPRPETVYVDQYGRPVEVVRVVERLPPPMYEYPPHQPDYYHREDPHARYLYYEQPPHAAPAAPQPGYAGPPRTDYGQPPGHPSRYTYDDGRASVPRN